MTHGVIKPISLMLLAVAAYGAGRDLIRGQRIEAVRGALDGSSPLGRDRMLAERERSGDTALSPTEAQGLAAMWIDQAAASPPPLRAHALAQAETLLAGVRRVRPDAPDASLLQVRLDMVRHGQPQPAAIAAFARSYRQAGFLREQGLWRLAFAATYWSRLSKETRAAVVDEAIWLARLDGRLRTAVDQLVTGTPLALPVELRLIR